MEKSTLLSHVNDIAQRLSEPNIYGSASVMIGAGFSKNASGVKDNVISPPNWAELAEAMYEELYPISNEYNRHDWETNRAKETAGKNVLNLAEKYESAFDRHKLNNLIQRNISDESYIPGELHKKLLELNWNDVFTTNYDTLLERTIPLISTRFSYKIVYTQNDLPGSVRPRIVKLHGSINSSKSFIITEEDYRTYPIKFTPFVNTVQQSMLETRLCLIGFSGDDPNFLSWLGWLRDNMGANCPQIYLCGIFNKMNDAEIKVLQNKRITVLDLSLLNNNNESHYEALNIFFDLLSEYSKKNECSIINNLNQLYDIKFDEKNIDGYYVDMMDYTNTLIKSISSFVVLPIEDTFRFSNFLYENHFLTLLSQQYESDKKFKLLGNVTTILHKTNCILDDSGAILLENILDDNDFNNMINNYNTDNLIIWFMISLYLLEMYRIDHEIKKYDLLKDKIDKFYEVLPNNLINEYMIENCKYYLSNLDYDNANLFVERIRSTSYDILIKKAALYSYLKKEDKTVEILNETLAKIVQQKLSENVLASILGYINLCSRTIRISGNNDLFSDDKYFNNQYNTRHIVINAQNQVLRKLYEKENAKNNITPKFNPNTYKITLYTDNSSIIQYSFTYLLLLDKLCLPALMDQKKVIKSCLINIIGTSKNEFWKWTKIINICDSKLIDTFFTREKIANTNLEVIEYSFDRIYSIITKNTDKLSLSLTIINLNVLARLCIVLDDNRIVNFIILLNVLYPSNSSDLDLKEIIRLLRYSINSNIIESILKKMIESEELFILDLILENKYVHDITFTKKMVKILMKKLQNDLRKDQLEIKTNSYLLLKFLLDNNAITKNEIVKFESIIWSQVDQFGYPKTDNLVPFFWDGLLDEKMIYQLHTKYFERPNFDKYDDENNNLRIYALSLNELTNINKNKMPIYLSIDSINSIHNYLIEYISNIHYPIEKKVDIFDRRKTIEENIYKIAEIIIILNRVCILENLDIGRFNENLNILNQLYITKFNMTILQEFNLSVNSFSNMDLIEAYIFSSDVKKISIAFVYLHSKLRIIEFKNTSSVLVDVILNIIKNLAYIELTIVNNILLHLSTIIKNKIFLKKDSIKILVKSFHKCFIIYSEGIVNNNKEALNALYNLSSLFKVYYEFIIDNNMEIEKSISELIVDFRSVKLNEIRNIWLGVNVKKE
jgi:hypothetical protein